MSTSGSRSVGIAMSLLVLLGLPACATNGLSFVQDQRLEIVQPRDRSTIELPLTLEWTTAGLDVVKDSGAFAVFVDRPPQPSGRTTGWLFRDDDACRGAVSSCSTKTFLEQNGVYVTTHTTIRLADVAVLTPNDSKRDTHEVTVVLLDGRGERIGESAWAVRFMVRGEV